MPAVPAELLPWRPTASDPWDRRRAAHLLTRAGFGANEAELDAAVELGMDRCVDVLTTFDDAPLPEWGTVVLPHGETLEVGRDLRSQRAAWFFEMVHGRAPLREKLALFWHDHFSVGSKYTSNRSHIVAHVNLLRRHAAGSLRTLFRALLRDPAMLIWLDNYSNGQPTDGVPRVNLNFSRELFELYTMGRDGGYTQDDVVAGARCLTGFGITEGLTTNGVEWRPDWHVGGRKTVLGTTIENDDGREDAYAFVDVLLRWPRSRRRIVTKLWNWLVDDAPTDAVVDHLAQCLLDDDFDVRSLVVQMLRSRAFHESRGRLVKNPVDYVVGALRQTGARIGDFRTLGDRVTAMAWPLLDYFTPAGLDDGLAWLTAQAVVTRRNFADELVAGGGELRAELAAESRSPAQWHACLLPTAPDARDELRADDAPNAVLTLLSSPWYQVT